MLGWHHKQRGVTARNEAFALVIDCLTTLARASTQYLGEGASKIAVVLPCVVITILDAT